MTTCKICKKSISEFILSKCTLSQNEKSSKSNPFILSKREMQIFKMIVSSFTTNEISRTLGVKANTISSIKKSIKFKLQVKSEIELYKIAIVNKIIF